MKNIKKVWLGSLGFLDNCYINSIILIILLLYCSTIFENINSFIGNLYNFSIVKLVILLLIIYVTPKDPTIGIFLGLSYIISLHFSQVNTENFVLNDYILPNKNNSDSEEVKESFFPLNNSDSEDVKESFFPLNNNYTETTDSGYHKESENYENNENACLNNYNPHYEAVGDVCNPVATFQNELNAQGINHISGFNESNIKYMKGSPI